MNRIVLIENGRYFLSSNDDYAKRYNACNKLQRTIISALGGNWGTPDMYKNCFYNPCDECTLILAVEPDGFIYKYDYSAPSNNNFTRISQSQAAKIVKKYLKLLELNNFR